MIKFDNIDFVEAVLVEFFVCCFYGFEKIKIFFIDRILIIGFGLIGFIMFEFVKMYGVDNIFGYEVDEFRKNVVKDYGVKVIVDEDCSEESFDVVIECVGIKESIEMVFKKLGKGGRVLVFFVLLLIVVIEICLFEMFRKEV